MSRPKTKADEQYNARRRMKRAVQRYNTMAQTFNDKQYAKIAPQVEALKTAISKSYYVKALQGYEKEYKASALNKQVKALNSVLKTHSKEFRASTLRKELTQAQNNRLSDMQKKHFTQKGQMVRWEQAQFYSRTQFIWQGSSPEQRNNAIVDYLESHGAMVTENGKEVPVTNLKYAFDFVKQKHAEDWERKHKSNKLQRQGKGHWSDEDEEFMQEQEEEDGSPDVDTDSMYGFA